MKVLIQIPCYNEEENLLHVLESLPKKLLGIEEISIQIIDDASTDKTIEIAKAFGVKYILKIDGPNKKNLGTAFQLGQKNALKEDFDILVNIDGDNQYPSTFIQALIDPILNGEADFVIGDRNPSEIVYFSEFKKFIQKIANQVISFLCNAEVPDAVSGFRAFSKKTLQELNLTEKYTYTIESLMQAHAKKVKLAWIDIKVNPPTRESRLIPNLFSKIQRSGFAAFKFYFQYFVFKNI